MRDADQLARYPRWQRARMLALHTICEEVQADIDAGATVRMACQSAAQAHACTLLQAADGSLRELRVSTSSITRHLYAWRQAGCTPLAFRPRHRGGRAAIPREVLNEYHRRQTLPGMSNAKAAYRSLIDDWQRGREIEGMGTWTQWWSRHRPEFPLPASPPEFPYSYEGMQRYRPSRAMKTWGNKGRAAAVKQFPWLTRDSSALRPGEVYVFDDVRLDLIAIDDLTKRPTEHQVYLAMEWGTRYIPAYVMRPTNAIVQQDVDQLTVMALQACGVGRDYVTHLIYERGTLTMSREAAELLERVSGGRIKVHFTAMNSSRPYPGAPSEEGKGHFMGKSILESFMRQLHARLMLLPGQRGNSYENQPATLGWSGQHRAAKKGTLIDEASKLLDIQLNANSRIHLDLGLLWTSDLNLILRDTIRAHNDHRDHTYQGFGEITQREAAPGVWEDLQCSS